jgi:hypothetical protein
MAILAMSSNVHEYCKKVLCSIYQLNPMVILGLRRQFAERSMKSFHLRWCSSGTSRIGIILSLCEHSNWTHVDLFEYRKSKSLLNDIRALSSLSFSVARDTLPAVIKRVVWRSDNQNISEKSGGQITAGTWCAYLDLTTIIHHWMARLGNVIVIKQLILLFFAFGTLLVSQKCSSKCLIDNIRLDLLDKKMQLCYWH